MWINEKNGYVYSANDGMLTIEKNGKSLCTLDLCPVVDGRKCEVLHWEKREGFLYGRCSDGEICVGEKQGYPLWYGLTLNDGRYARVEYFPGSNVCSSGMRTFLSDYGDREWDMDQDVNIPVSSAYSDLFHVDETDGAGMLDPGDKPVMFHFDEHIKAVGFRFADAEWLGLMLPGPCPVGVTRFMLDRGKFSIVLEEVQAGAKDHGLPEVYFDLGLDHSDRVLEQYGALSKRLGYMVERSGDHPSWWTNPVYKCWAEFLRQIKEGDEVQEVPNGEEYLVSSKKGKTPAEALTRESISGWLGYVKEQVGIRQINTTFEQGCFRYYGDYTPVDSLGGSDGFRSFVDSLRDEQTRAGFYMHPFLVNKKTDTYKNNPQAFCKPKNPAKAFRYGLEFYDTDPEYALVDWTHPTGREMMLNIVEYILSDRPGCLNCDIIRSNHWRSPDPRDFDFHDPSWGIGDLMTMKVQKLIYQRAKAVKPDCMVSKLGAGESFMQPWCDINYMSEDWSPRTDYWYKRARIATRIMDNVLFMQDPFVTSLTKSYEYFMGLSGYIVPEISHVRHALHPQIYYRELREKDYRRRRAGLRVYMNAKANITDQCRVDWDDCNQRVKLCRKYTRGPLTGWYAILSVGKRCLISYSETEIMIAASEGRMVDVPIPPGFMAENVMKINHEGDRTDWRHQTIMKDDHAYIRLYIEDAAGDTMCIRIGLTACG